MEPPQIMGAAINQQQHRHSKVTSLSHWGLNAFYWYQIFTLGYVVAKTHKKMFSSHRGFLTIAMYHRRETI